MNDGTDFSDVRRRLRPGDVFTDPSHNWEAQSDRRWKGGCPWHGSDSGTCFAVNPETLEWYCFHCERGGGPLEYVAELEGIGGGVRGLKGEDFFRTWEALADHAGCEAPPDFSEEKGSDNARDERRPLRKGKRQAEPQAKARGAKRPESASTTSGGAPRMFRDIRPGGTPGEPTLDTPERELREALVRYREALKGSEKARAYVEGRGLTVETLHGYGCGFAPAGEWIGPGSGPRLVTPHTAPPTEGGRPKLVNLSGRYLGQCPAGKRHRHITGNPTALFNASAVTEGAGPLVLCEGPLDALSFIEAGRGRAVALHNTAGVPWKALRGNADVLVFAFDNDDTGREDAVDRAREAVLRGYEAHVLPDGEGTYGGHNDPNDALQAGALNLSYLADLAAGGSGNPMEGADSEESHARPGSASSENLMTPGGRPFGSLENNPMNGAAGGPEKPANGRDPEADQSPTAEPTGEDGGDTEHTAADLVPHWNGSDVGHLGRWLWERGGVPDGDVGGGLYADRALHKWVAEKLQAGPAGTDEQDRIRLRWVLWRLYAMHGPEDVPERQIPIPPMRRA